ncbi:MAG: hypothetical protein OXI65_10390 [Acidobacteriota bacterium]|nr:hypothetical protein [Acidobacteriota bacterium]
MSSERDTRPDIVAKFLKDDPRYLELALEVEAGLRHLRDQANQVVTSRLDEELANWEKKSGWKLARPRRSAGWVLLPQGAGWQETETWSGVWLWRPSARSLDFTVGVEGWPDGTADLKTALLGVVEASQDRGAWSPHPQNAQWRNKVQWVFRWEIQLLGDDPETGIKQIVALVQALVTAATTRT